MTSHSAGQEGRRRLKRLLSNYLLFLKFFAPTEISAHSAKKMRGNNELISSMSHIMSLIYYCY